MYKRTWTSERVVYEFTEEEFKEKLGIDDPRHVLTVRSALGEIAVVMMKERAEDSHVQ